MKGPAVFYKLKFLRAGDRIDVTLADGRVGHFVVDKVATYANNRFPARQVYGSHGFPGLQLVTCGGPYDRRAHSYTANVVVFTTFVSAGPGRGTPPA
jgi:hypothetical protein